MLDVKKENRRSSEEISKELEVIKKSVRKLLVSLSVFYVYVYIFYNLINGVTISQSWKFNIKLNRLLNKKRKDA